MRFPNVETDNGFSLFRRLYYIDGEAPGPTARTDVGSDTLALASQILAAVEFAGDEEDLLDATLLWAAAQTVLEIQPSVTRVRLTAALEKVHGSVSEVAVADAIHRSQRILAGAALIGALRALAHTAIQFSSRSWHVAVAAAYEAQEEVGAISVLPMLAADRGHVYLRLSAQDATDSEASAQLAHFGSTLLVGAWAQACLEPWNPFVLHRLRAELIEHEQWIGKAEMALAQQLSIEAAAHWVAPETRWVELTGKLGDDLFAALSIPVEMRNGMQFGQVHAEAQVARRIAIEMPR